MRLRAIFFLLAGTMTLLVPGGCAPNQAGEVGGGSPAMSSPELRQAWNVIRGAQSRRLERLSTFSSSGQLTMRWQEDGRNRWEQADARIWWSMPGRMALRLSRVGSRLVMAGWNNDVWWVFDEMSDDTTLSIFPVDLLGQGEDRLMSPPLLLALAGLIEFPTDPPADFKTLDDGVFGFTVSNLRLGAGGRSGMAMGLNAYVELDRSGPRRMELRGPAGEVVAMSDLDDRRSVECRGVAQGAWPVLAYQIRASMPGAAGVDSRVTVSIDRPLAGGSVPERVFDLEAVRSSVQPKVVIDQRGDG